MPAPKITSPKQAAALLKKHGRFWRDGKSTRALVPGSEARLEVKAACNYLNRCELGLEGDKARDEVLGKGA